MSKFHIIPFYKQLSYIDDIDQTRVGYFEDVFTPEEHKQLFRECAVLDLNIVATLKQLYQGLQPPFCEQRKAIVCFFGCFAPMHDGHINAIDLAIKEISKTHCYMRTIIYPAHDDYVSTKSQMTNDMMMSRISLLKRTISTHFETVVIDEFPLKLKGEINFPYLISRTLSYAYCIDPIIDDIDVFYILGDDNKDFADVNYTHVRPIVIQRFDESFDDPYPNTIYVKADDYFRKCSSTQLRVSCHG